MKILSFDYTKADGKTSARTVVVFAEPTKLYAGTDISSLDEEDQALYVSQIQTAQEIYLDMIAQANKTFDLKYNYRQFKPENMANVEEEEI